MLSLSPRLGVTSVERMGSVTTLPRWTLVQHSAFGYNQDPTFRHGLEVREVRTLAEQRKVVRYGGVLFASYDRAVEAEDEVAYPDGRQALTPRAKGTFATADIDGLKIYVPAATEEIPGLVGVSVTA